MTDSTWHQQLRVFTEILYQSAAGEPDKIRISRGAVEDMP